MGLSHSDVGPLPSGRSRALTQSSGHGLVSAPALSLDFCPSDPLSREAAPFTAADPQEYERGAVAEPQSEQLPEGQVSAAPRL